MSRALHIFTEPARFVSGTVGRPGDRTFYLQAHDGPRTISVLCEKLQVEILSDRMTALLEQVKAQTDAEIPPPAVFVDDLDPLIDPIDPEFRIGTMGLGWDGDTQKIVVEMLALSDTDIDESVILADDENGPDALRVYLSPAQARKFVLRSERVISAGRAPCPLCDQPITADGHVCRRLNGYQAREGFDPNRLADS